jgi:hypothetical protein
VNPNRGPAAAQASAPERSPRRFVSITNAPVDHRTPPRSLRKSSLRLSVTTRMSCCPRRCGACRRHPGLQPPLTRRGVCALWPAAGRSPAHRRPSPCACGSHAAACAPTGSADRSVSPSMLHPGRRLQPLRQTAIQAPTALRPTATAGPRPRRPQLNWRLIGGRQGQVNRSRAK